MLAGYFCGIDYCGMRDIYILLIVLATSLFIVESPSTWAANENSDGENKQKDFGLAPNPFFIPENARCNDTFPFYHEGIWHLFLMRLPVIAHYVSKDLIQWQERPIAVEYPGSNMLTGCVVESKGRFYCFYTFNGISLSISDDLDHWKKYENNPVLTGDDVTYEQSNFRDPYVFFNEEEKIWWMVFCSRMPGQPGQRAGCVGLAKSKDLIHWEFAKPVWAPMAEPFLECPQLFKHKDRWYLSMLARHTRCRVADSLSGPWNRPSIRDMGTLMAHANSRPATDGKRWISFPFILVPTERKELLANADFLGGPIGIPRQWNFNEDGSVTQRPADEIISAMHAACNGARKSLSMARVVAGKWELNDGSIARCVDESAGTILLDGWPKDFYFEADVNFSKEDMECHVLLNVNEEISGGYELSLCPRPNMVTLRPLTVWERAQSRVLEMCPIDMAGNRPIKLRIFRSGTIIEVFVDDRAVLTHRLFQHSGGFLGLEFRDGAGTFSNILSCQLAPVNEKDI
ncbi:MAG: hypothetical protein A2Y12_15145 [Planctomycetes bacterium GWF2_42_9]|nr:MAG: hypothetical protein A2Y12_15145 [Planctomycetes bacterium GWF2_42_9]